jgi:hypothetical protein
VTVAEDSAKAPAVDHKKFAELIELLGEFRPVLEVFHGESERGAILVAASLLDAAFRELLALVMVLGKVRRIRNECAHSPHSVDFNTDKVRVPEPQRTPEATLIRARFLMNAGSCFPSFAWSSGRADTVLEMSSGWSTQYTRYTGKSWEQKQAKRMQEFAEREAELDARAKAIHDDFEKELAAYAETAASRWTRPASRSRSSMKRASR